MGGHERRQGQSVAQAHLELPALHLQSPQDRQVTGIGAVAVLGAGSAAGIGGRWLQVAEQLPMARRSFNSDVLEYQALSRSTPKPHGSLFLCLAG